MPPVPVFVLHFAGPNVPAPVASAAVSQQPFDRRCLTLTSSDSGVHRVAGVSVAVWDGARDTEPVVVLAHGAGSSLRHAVHLGVCTAVADAGPTVVSFNFPYAEAERRSPDRMPRLLDCFREILDWVRQEFAGRRIVTGGRSMGGRAASLLEAQEPGAAGLVLLNYPLVAASAKPGAMPRTEHWPQLGVPVLFVHGTRDRLLPQPLLTESLPLLRAASVTVHVVEGADHGFAVPRSTGNTADDVYQEVGATVAQWVMTLQ